MVAQWHVYTSSAAATQLITQGNAITYILKLLINDLGIVENSSAAGQERAHVRTQNAGSEMQKESESWRDPSLVPPERADGSEDKEREACARDEEHDEDEQEVAEVAAGGGGCPG